MAMGPYKVLGVMVAQFLLKKKGIIDGVGIQIARRKPTIDNN